MYNKKILVIGLVGLMLAGCSSSGSSQNSNSTVSSETSVSKVQTNARPGVGETVTTNEAKITINSAQTLDQVDDVYHTSDRLEEGKKYELIDVTIENISDKAMKISSALSFELKNGEGRKQKYELPIGTDGQMDGEIAPGDKLSGQLVYMVDADGELVLAITTKVVGGEAVRFKIR